MTAPQSPNLSEQYQLRMRCIQLATKMTRGGIPIHEGNRTGLRIPNEEKLAEYTRVVEETALELGWNKAAPKFSHWFESDELTKGGKPKKARAYVAEAVPFNPESGDHWTELLIGRLGLEPLKFTKKAKKPAWDEEVIGHLIASANPLISRLARYGQRCKQLQKELSNYITGLPVWPDGNIYPYWAAMDANTCRWTCRGPAAQTIPRGMRGVISALRCTHCGRWGWVVESDFSQQEPRVLACQSGDEILLDCYRNKLDVYKIVAQPLFGVSYKNVTPLQRQATKVDFLSLCYGAGVHTRKVALHAASESFRNIDETALSRMAKAFFKEHPWVKKYHHRMEDAARAGVITEPLSGHQLHTGGYVDPALIYNFPIQTAGAYQTNNALLEVDESLDPRIERIYMNVHDAIVTGSLREDPLEIVRLHQQAMEKEWVINGNSLPFLTETKLSSDSLGHALELKSDLTFKAGSLRDMDLGLAMAAVPQEGCSECRT